MIIQNYLSTYLSHLIIWEWEKEKGKEEERKNEDMEQKSFANSEDFRMWTAFGCAVLTAQSYPTLYDPMDCSLPGSSARGDFPGKNTAVGCHALF